LKEGLCGLLASERIRIDREAMRRRSKKGIGIMGWFSREIRTPKGMIDIHNHVLPGIDDGAGDWEESLAMMRAFVEAGFSTISVSTHLHHPLFPDNTAQEIRLLATQAQEKADAAAIPLRILPGCEVYFQDALFSWLENEQIVPVSGQGAFVLIEFPMRDPMLLMAELGFQLQVKGVRPILAHPERYDALHKKPALLREWRRAGWLMQLDLPSITGETGVPIQRLAIQILKDGLFDYAASDLHKSPDDPNYFKAMLEKLVKMTDEEEAERLMVVNPSRLLEGKMPKAAIWLEEED
jgi:protein-tyrosine phosphatase